MLTGFRDINSDVKIDVKPETNNQTFKQKIILSDNKYNNNNKYNKWKTKQKKQNRKSIFFVYLE